MFEKSLTFSGLIITWKWSGSMTIPKTLNLYFNKVCLKEFRSSSILLIRIG